ncbi:MAG: hypothetical protein LBN06_02655 [Prevotellaceae bacterium]|jgi:hypothetical protein|nr:hypothetical protein [Prevotellaceae bacterium]
MDKIVYYTSKSEINSPLFVDIEQMVNSFRCELCVRIIEESSQLDFLLDAHNELVIIADCSIPQDFSRATIYPLLTAQVNAFNHILVYSKELDKDGWQILPLNITPQRQRKNSDKDLVLWLKSQIADIVEHSGYYTRLAIKGIDDLMPNKLAMEKMLTESLDLKRGYDGVVRKRVMISYRNDFSEAVGNLVVKYQDEYEIRVLPSGSLCGEYEAHTPMRRWMLVGLLEDFIREVDEVWIYLTENYARSWWTLAEVIMTMNLNYHNSDPTQRKRVRVYDPITEDFLCEDKYPNFLNVVINDAHYKKLARYLSNTRPATMGPEMLSQVRKLKRIAFILRVLPKFVYHAMIDNMRKYLDTMVVPTTIPEEDRQEMIDDMCKMYSDPNELKKYASDKVFQNEFWNNISYQTNDGTPSFINGTIDVDIFIDTPMMELTKYSEKELEREYEKGRTIELKSNQGKRVYELEKGSIRYLWLATRMGKPTIKDAPGLECIQTYNLKGVKKM